MLPTRVVKGLGTCKYGGAAAIIQEEQFTFLLSDLAETDLRLIRRGPLTQGLILTTIQCDTLGPHALSVLQMNSIAKAR